jgi:hypothetical protein
MWMHEMAGNSLCLTERIITSMQAVAPNYMTILFGLVLLLVSVMHAATGALKIELHNRWPAGFLWQHHFWFLHRDYILQALGRGILHSRVY